MLRCRAGLRTQGQAHRVAVVDTSQLDGVRLTLCRDRLLRRWLWAYKAARLSTVSSSFSFCDGTCRVSTDFENILYTVKWGSRYVLQCGVGTEFSCLHLTPTCVHSSASSESRSTEAVAERSDLWFTRRYITRAAEEH